jgi:hypothetical protein
MAHPYGPSVPRHNAPRGTAGRSPRSRIGLIQEARGVDGAARALRLSQRRPGARSLLRQRHHRCRVYEHRSTVYWRVLTVTHCGRICFHGRKVNLSHAFAGQNVGVTQVGDRIWLVTFMQYDLGYFDDETCRLEPIDNPFGSKVLPMSPEWTARKWRARQDSNLLAASGSESRQDLEAAARSFSRSEKRARQDSNLRPPA